MQNNIKCDKIINLNALIILNLWKEVTNGTGQRIIVPATSMKLRNCSMKDMK